jgi:hypothetical protein
MVTTPISAIFSKNVLHDDRSSGQFLFFFGNHFWGSYGPRKLAKCACLL